VKNVFHLLNTIATKKNEKKSPGSDVDPDSTHSEDSDESSVKKIRQKKRSPRRPMKPNVSNH
jgi:hypothetical protein